MPNSVIMVLAEVGELCVLEQIAGPKTYVIVDTAWLQVGFSEPVKKGMLIEFVVMTGHDPEYVSSSFVLIGVQPTYYQFRRMKSTDQMTVERQLALLLFEKLPQQVEGRYYTLIMKLPGISASRKVYGIIS